jgi:hypothetical protein
MHVASARFCDHYEPSGNVDMPMIARICSQVSIQWDGKTHSFIDTIADSSPSRLGLSAVNMLFVNKSDRFRLCNH